MSDWKPLETAPTDQWVILATSGDWVGEAIYGEDEENPRWRWAKSGRGIYLHPNLVPLAWQPLPKHPSRFR